MEHLQLTINRVRLEVGEARTKVSDLQAILIDIDRRLVAERQTLSNLLQREKSLPGELETAKDKLTSLNVSVRVKEMAVQVQTSLWNKRPPKPKKLLDSEKELASLKKDRDAAKLVFERLDKENARLPDQKKRANEEIKRLEGDKPGKETALNAAKMELASLEEQYQNLNAEQMQQLATVVGALPIADLPVAFLPVHLQTRFRSSADQHELLIRIMPDTLHVDTHEPELTDSELAYGKHYWERIWRSGLKQDDASEIQRQNAWAQLCQRFGPRRAAWIVRTLTPLNPGDQPTAAVAEDQALPKTIRFSSPAHRATSWTRAPQARLLPDRWVAYGYREGERILLAWGQPIPDRLHIGPDPQAPPPNDLSDDKLAIDQGIQWLFDFQEAENSGMAIRAPLSPEEAQAGIDLLIVLGVRNTKDGSASAAELEQLIAAHHYTDGLAFVPQGTPTNNTEEGQSGFSSDDPGYATSFNVERKTPSLATTEPCDGLRLAQAIGINPTVFDRIQHAQRQEYEEARFMRAALWPVTWGYFLEQMIGNGAVSSEIIQQIRRHFIDYVSGSGALPVIRTGKQPYGILPVTAINHWKAETTNGIPGRLISFLQMPASGSDQLTTLRQIWRKALQFVPSAANRGAEEESWLELVGGILSMEAISGQFQASTLVENPEKLEQAEKLLQQLGIGGKPRLLQSALLDERLNLDAPLTTLGQKENPPHPDYIQWLNTADFQDLVTENGISVDGQKPNILLYLLLRHAALLAHGTAAPADRDEMRTSLQMLGKLTAGRLEDLFRETIDLCSHRLDAWAASLASRRLSAMREKKASGVQLGGFGWVEDLRPAPPLQPIDTAIPGEEGSPIYAQANNGGFIHAPSLDHAATAAILRSGYLAQNSRRDSSQFAVDLSSERARLAQRLLDGVRQGQSLSALLGYRFERGLHERGLDQYIESFRLLAPLVSLYKAKADVSACQQKVDDMAKWKSAELKAAEAGYAQLYWKITEFKKLYDKLYKGGKLRRDLEAILKEINAVKVRIDLGTISNNPYFLIYQWEDKLKKEITAANAAAKEFAKIHDELIAYAYRFPANSTGKIIVKVNHDGPNQFQKLNWPSRVIAKEDSSSVRAGLKTISDGKPVKLHNTRVHEVLVEFGKYIKDLRRQSHPDLASAEAELDSAKSVLDQLTQAHRKQFLLPPEAGVEAMETLPAQNVVDGLALLRLWRDDPETIPFGKKVDSKKVVQLPARGLGRDYNGLVAELNALADAVDAVGDAITAESMYHLVKGNPLRAGVSLDAIARGELPPAELEFLKTPRSGTSLTHRVFMLLNERMAGVNWPTTPKQSRAKAEPVLNAWVGQMLGSAEKILVQAEYQHPETKAALAAREIRLSELKLSPLDFVYMTNRDAIPLQSELEQRLAYHLLRTRPEGIPLNANLALFFERGENWQSDQFCLAEMLEAGRTIREVIAKARPLQVRDLGMPGAESQSTLDTAELLQRTNQTVKNFETAKNALSKLLENPEKASLEALRVALLELAGFGVPGSIPVSAAGDSPADRQNLLEQGHAVLVEANRRWKEAQDLKTASTIQNAEQAVAYCTNCMQIIFSSDFPILPLLKFSESNDAVETIKQSDAWQDNDPFAVCGWIERTSRVREGVARLNDALLYSQALSQNYENRYKVGQLPKEPDGRWAALPLREGQQPPAGCVSLVAYMPWGLDPALRQAGLMIDEWVEVIPHQKQITGVAFHYDQPGARAPQAILLAVPPEGTERWSMEGLEAVLLETNELLKLRTVDLEALSRLEEEVVQFLPAVYLSLPNGNEISTDPNRALNS